MDEYEKYFVASKESVVPKNSVKITFFGTTTLLFDDGETQILFDALFTRPSLFKIFTSKIETNKNLVDSIIKKQGMNNLNAIFISHSHYDHVLDAAYIANRTNAKIYGSESTLNVGRGGGVLEENLVLFDIHKPVQVGKFEVTVLPSIHSKPTVFNDDLGVPIDTPLKQPAKMRDYKEGGSFDFLVKYGDKKVLIRPSFNYIEGSLDNVHADLLFLGITRLGKEDISQRDKFYAETVKKVKPSFVIPIHWDNFFLSINKPLRAPIKLIDDLNNGLDYMIEKTNQDGISFKLMQSFESILLHNIQ